MKTAFFLILLMDPACFKSVLNLSAIMYIFLSKIKKDKTCKLLIYCYVGISWT